MSEIKLDMRMSGFGTITLGGLIDALEEWCVAAEKDSKGAAGAKKLHVFFDWAWATPKSLDSYRGYYDHLALGFGPEDESMSVGELLIELNGAIGKTYTGWKGGDFKMDRKTPVWIGNSGHCSGTVITGVGSETYAAFIQTAHEDDNR